MKPFLHHNDQIIPFVLPIFLSVLLFAAPSFGAVLNPFPSPERIPVYQQTAPGRSRQPQPANELEQFSKDLQHFSCADIEELSQKLQQQLNAATTVADRNYFQGFLNALRAEEERKCN